MISDRGEPGGVLSAGSPSGCGPPIAGKVPLWSVAVEVLPFLAWSLVVLLMITGLPGLVTWLPNTLM